jgi:hypothetical protein
MRLDELYLWCLADAAAPRYVGALKLVADGSEVPSARCDTGPNI